MAGRIKWKKRKRSVGKTMRRQLLLVAVVVFAAATFLMSVVANLETRLVLAFNASTCAALSERIVNGIGGFEEYADSVMEVYRSVPEDIRLRKNDAEYRSYFSSFENSDFVRKAKDVFQKTIKVMLLGNIYFSVYDEVTDTMVCVYSTDMGMAGSNWEIGEWEEADPTQMEFYMNPEFDRETFINYYRERSKQGQNFLTGGVPIMNEKGKVVGFCEADVSLVVVKAVAVIVTVIFFFMLLVIIVLVSTLARIRVNKRLVKPIRKISEAVEQYSQGKKEGVTDKIYFGDLQIKTRDELEDLSNVMSGMEKDISEYEKNLMQATAERERMKTELAVGASIQTEMLPDCSAFSDRKDFWIAAAMDPAKEVGGDFYDFFLLDEDHLGLVMADVSGKGIPAALFMMSSMIIIHNYASEGYSPAEILEKSNDRICRSNKIDMFVTVWLGILDLKTGKLTAANAGHEYPIIRHAGGDFELLKDKHGLVVGAMEGVHYHNYTLTLEKGSTIFQYTDGLPEATNNEEEMFGTDRVVQILNKLKDETPEEILREISGQVDAFVAGAPQFDDLTMMCVVYNGQD